MPCAIVYQRAVEERSRASSGRCRASRKRVPAGDASRSATIALDRARRRAPTRDLVAVGEAEALGVGGRQLDALARGAGTSAPGRRSTSGAGPDRAERAQAQARRSAPPARRRASPPAGRLARPGTRGGARARASAAPLPPIASRRQPGVERHGREELRGGHRAGEDAEVDARGAWRARRGPTTRARRRPGGRSPGAGAARGRRGA